MDYVEISNSMIVYLLCGITVAIAFVQAVLYIRMAKKMTVKANIPATVPKTAFRVGLISAIGPALGVFIVMVGLMTSIGGPMAWQRLSIIGAAPTELTAATLGAEAAGAELTISGFTATYGGWVSIFTAIAMCCFAFSTIIGWGLYGVRCIEFLFGTRVNKPFMLVYSLVAIVGATMNLGLLWSIAETFNGLMVIPNLIAVFLLSGVVVKMVKDYFNGIETY